MAGFEPGPANPEPFSAGGIHTQPAFDLIEVLPEGAADRLRKLRQHVADLHALTVPFADIHEASNAKLEAERQLKRLTNHQHHGGFDLKPDDPRVIVAEQHLAKLVAHQRRLNDRNETRSAAWREAGHPLVNVETWLRDGRPPGTVLQDYDGPEPKLVKNETVIDAIERLRRRGRDLNADLNRIRSAPFPSAHARAKIKREVEALAQAGAPVVSDVLEHDRSVVWPMQRLQGAIINSQVPSFAVTEVPDVLGLFAFLNKEQLLASLDAGCSANVIASITGHRSLNEVERYTRAADQARMAREGMAMLIEQTEKRTELATQSDRVASSENYRCDFRGRK